MATTKMIQSLERAAMILELFQNQVTELGLKEIVEKTGLNKKDVKRTIDEMQKLIIQEVKGGQRICLHGFGSFKPRFQSSRPARNLKNGTAVQLSPRTIIHFKCAPHLLEQMNN